IGAYTEAVLNYADVAVAPVPAGAFALQGLGEIQTAWQDVREGGGKLVVAVNQWDRRTAATNEAMEAAFKELTVPVCKSRIPRSEAINQAGLGYELVFDVSPQAPGVEELRALSVELAAHAGLKASAFRPGAAELVERPAVRGARRL